MNDEKRRDDDLKEEGIDDGQGLDDEFRLTKENFPPVKLTLIYFIQLLLSHAYIYLGYVPIPGTEEVLFDLGQAKEAIDLLEIMVEQAKPGLDEKDRRELDNELAQLRINFASKAEKTK